MEVVATHKEVSQVSYGGELRGHNIKRLSGAATVGTQYEEQFTIDFVWWKVRRKFPDKLQAPNKVCVDDARLQWTRIKTYSSGLMMQNGISLNQGFALTKW